MIWRYLTIFLLFFLFSMPVHGMSPAMLMQTQMAGGEDCPDYGTYTSAWNGDYPSDTDKACYNSGASQKDGTNTGSGSFSTSYGESGSVGWRYTTDDDNVTYTNSGNDLVDDAEGTLWIKFRCASSVSALTGLFDLYESSNNRLTLKLNTDDKIRSSYIGDGDDYHETSSGTVTCDGSAWNTVGVAWKQNEAGNDHAVSTDDTWGNGDDSESDDDLTTMTSDITDVVMGNDAFYGDTENIDYDQWAILPTYKASCPW